jgi:intein/homing endonuclease
MAVLIQYAIDDGPVHLHSPWKEPISKTLELIEWLCENTVVGFNLAFDWFHLCKIYTTFSLYHDYDALPEDHIDELAVLEEQARTKGLCIKPKDALDLMLYSRKGPYQCLMARKDIRIRRVPKIMAERLCSELANRVQLDGIYFNNRKDPTAPQWNITDSEDKKGNKDPEFRDIVLKFKPSASLKSLAQYLLNVKEDLIYRFMDVNPPAKFNPKEEGYAPFALAFGRPGRWNGTWPEMIKYHSDHWRFNSLARKYAENDVIYTRALHKHPKFANAAPGDDDSILACMVGAVRWRGFNVDLERIKQQRAEALKESKKAPKAPNAVKRWMREVMDSDEFLVLETDKGTSDVVLQSLTGTKDEKNGENGLIITWVDGWEDDEGNPHPAAIRARAIREARAATKEVELYDKLLTAKRFHASFIVIGTLSTRMSGSDGLNPQGIISSKFVRSCFTLKDSELNQLDGGDFVSFEVCISAAVYKDKGLEEDLKSGKKIHALLAQAIFPEVTYDQVMASKGAKSGRDYYTDGKRAVFGLNYGGDANTLVNRLGVSEEVAEDTFKRFYKRYPGVERARKQIIEWFCVVGDTWTLTTNGPEQIKNLTGRCTLIVNDARVQIEGFMYTGYKDIFEIETVNGHRVRTTEEHPFLVNYFSDLSRGNTGLNIWTQVKDLKPGLSINLIEHRNLNWSGVGTYGEGWLLGWLVGDGSISKRNRRRLIFNLPDAFLLNKAVSFLTDYEIKEIKDSGIFFIVSKELDTLAERFGLYHGKIIDSVIEKASSEFLEGFCCAFFDADGSAREDVRQITLSQSNLTRLQVVQRILLRFGINSSIKKIKEAGKYTIQGRSVNCKTSYRLSLYSANVSEFYRRIGFSVGYKRDAVELSIESCDPKKMRREYFTSKIKSITYCGKDHVYNTTVPEIQCFEANGFLTHNCSMRQPRGIGTAVEWHEPRDYVESLLGFRRYFTLENQICKALYDLANSPPKEWTQVRVKVVRRDREQSASGAVRSALFGAAFGLQGNNMRAAANHIIQSTGAGITKAVERKIWDLQPSGVSPWKVAPINIHDEILVALDSEISETVEKVVKEEVEKYRPLIPLIEIDWNRNMNNWGEK